MNIQSTCIIRRFYRVLLLLVIVAMLLPNAASVQAASRQLPEPYTDLYVVYNNPDAKIITVELRDQHRLPSGAVSAAIAVRAETLIAYNLTFEENLTSGSAWEELDFLPLYPGHAYDIATITIEPGGYFTIRGTKFGTKESDLPKITLIQLSILVMHLVGAKPPIDTHEAAQAVADSFSIVVGPIGTFATAISAVLEIVKTERDNLKALKNIAEVVVEVPKLPDLIAKVINLMVKEGPKVTGGMVEGTLKALFNVVDIVGNLKRTWDAYQQLKNLPDPVVATITLAPTVVERPERYRIFEINENFQTSITFQNVGSEVWLPQDYELLILLESFVIADVPLARHVAIGQSARWNIPQKAPVIPGIYHLTYQVVWRGVPIGQPVPGEIVVVPEKSSNLKSLLNNMIQETQRKAGERFDEFRQELERNIQRAIMEEIERRLREICGGTSAILILSVILALSERRKR